MKNLILITVLFTSLNASANPFCSVYTKFSDFFSRPETATAPLKADVESSILNSKSTFGPEFTFTNQTLVDEGNKALQKSIADGRGPWSALKTPFNMEKYEKIKESLKERCASRGDCKTTIGYDKHGENIRVTYRDGWYFEVGIDMCVIETQTKPGTITDFMKNKSRLEADLWQVAESLDLRPHFRAGQGHLHIGLNAFDGDPMLFRNFFVDFSNRPELAYGALGNHLGNSPPIAALKPEQREQLTKSLQEFDASEVKSITGFASLIHWSVYTESTNKDWQGGSYYHAIRLDRALRLGPEATVEIRAFRPQRTVDEYILQLKLIQARINFLKGKEPIAFNDTGKYEYSAQEIVNSFHQYVTEAGLKWETYRVLLPPKFQNIQPNGQPILR